MNGKTPRKKKGKAGKARGDKAKGGKAGKAAAKGAGATKGAAAGGLLKRLFGGDKDGKQGGKAAKGDRVAASGATPDKARPLTPLERSIQEIKHMTKVGKSDPERLAMMLSKLLQQEKQKQAQAQESFERMVWDIVHKDESGGDEGDDADSPPDAAPSS